MNAYSPGSEARPLPECHEARGQLLRVFEVQGQCVGVWAWGCCSFPDELREKLESLVGQTCAIFRLEGRFLVRDLEGEEHATG